MNHSRWDCTLESPTLPFSSKLITGSQQPFALRLGLRLIGGLSERHAETIVSARDTGDFTSQEDFARRTRLARSVITHLADADALASLGRDRRQALWEALAQEQQPRDFPLFDGLESEDEQPVALPELGRLENVFADYETFGLSLRAIIRSPFFAISWNSTTFQPLKISSK